MLECQGDDPINDEWIERGKNAKEQMMIFSFEAFSLMLLSLKTKENIIMYGLKKVSVGPQISNLYIAEMESGYKLKTVQVLLTTPDYDWERHGFWVNEGPAVIKHDGKDFPHIFSK